MNLHCYWRNVYVLFYLFAIFQVLDWVSTVMFLNAGISVEANPIAQYLFGFGIWLPLLTKLVLCVFAFAMLGIVWVHKHKPKNWMDYWVYTHRFRIVRLTYLFLTFMGAFVVMNNFSMFFSY